MSRVYPAWAWVALALAGPAAAHPHVFVDGGVDFIFGPDRTLQAVDVTWRFDAFETLYTMSANDISPEADGTLSGPQLDRLASYMSAWPDAFKGSAHLSLDGTALDLDRPRDFATAYIDGRLEVTFTRDLSAPQAIDGAPIEVSFHEETYYYAFAVTDPPAVHGAAADCAPDVIPYTPSEEDGPLLGLLGALGREETPRIANVGALFADRIVVTCD